MGPRAIRPASIDGWASHSSPGPERGGQTCLPSESEEAETRGKPLRASWVLAAAAPRGPAAFLLWSREIPCFSHDEVLTAQASSNWLHLICHQMALRRTHGLLYYIKGLSMRRGCRNALPVKPAGAGGLSPQAAQLTQNAFHPRAPLATEALGTRTQPAGVLVGASRPLRLCRLLSTGGFCCGDLRFLL